MSVMLRLNGRPSGTVITIAGRASVHEQTLAAYRLLDELHLNMTPVVAGRGRRLFDEPLGLLAFDLLDSRTYPTGAVRLVCRPPARAGEDAHDGCERLE